MGADAIFQTSTLTLVLVRYRPSAQVIELPFLLDAIDCALFDS